MNDQTPQPNAPQFPNLLGYLDEFDYNDLTEQHTTSELQNLELAFDQIESAMILIRSTAEINFMTRIHDAINTIWDNSHDLLDD